MKNKLLIFFLTLCALFFILAAQRSQAEYRSAWVTLQPGQIYSFAHPLNRQPDVLAVWTKLPGLTLDIETIRPHTELGGAISVQDVSILDVSIQNLDDNPWAVMIFVR